MSDMDQAKQESLLEIVRNDSGLYEGDLKRYFQYVFFHAENLRLPYHNFRHTTFVLAMCHMISGQYSGQLTKRAIRNLLIAALFHDYNHTGILVDDRINIELAIKGLGTCLLPGDEDYQDDIFGIIRITEYTNDTMLTDISLTQAIIRDADVLQAFSSDWIQEIILNLSEEQKESPIGMLRLQIAYLEGLRFHTDWAKETYPKSAIEAKVSEVRELLELVEPAST